MNLTVSSPGQVPVSRAKPPRAPRSTIPFVSRNTAPSIARAAISFGSEASRWSGPGGSSSSISAQTRSNPFRASIPARRPEMIPIGM